MSAGLIIINLDMGATKGPGNASNTAGNATTSSAGGANQNLMRGGLNAALRGYSPSKPYWKQGGAMPVSKGGHKGQPIYGNNMHVPGPSQGMSSSGHTSGFGSGNHPGVYTRLTKHTPSAK